MYRENAGYRRVEPNPDIPYWRNLFAELRAGKRPPQRTASSASSFTVLGDDSQGGTESGAGEKPVVQDTAWLAAAVNVVEQAIDAFVDEFMEFPYLHRREQSLHTQLFYTMMKHYKLAERFKMRDGQTIQLIHKEWPETIAETGHKKGNFDMVVLSPASIQACPSVNDFDTIPAPIVIEMGLDYYEGQTRHLSIDKQKLQHSEVPHGYLIHLVRSGPDTAAEQIIKNTAFDKNIKIAYVAYSSGNISYKHLNDKGISQKP
jgi:hypothetical protein